jgi:hypothetical protein
MSFFISTKKIKNKKIKNKKNINYQEQDITKERVEILQKGAGKSDNITIEISKDFLDLESDLYLQGPKKMGIKGAKEIIKEMKENGKDACKKAKKHLKKFIEARKNGSKPEEEEVARAVFDAFVLYVCKSKYIKLSNKDLSKMSKK